MSIRPLLPLGLLATLACHPHAVTTPSVPGEPQVGTPSASPPRLRLGDVASPIHYALRLRVVPTEDNFRGSVEIDLSINRSLSTLWLNGTDLTIEEATLEKDGKSIHGTPVSGGKEFIGIDFQRSIAPGPARLRLRYTGLVSKRDSRGLFRQQEGEAWYLISQFESHYARLALPCFDEPSFKVPWRLTLEVRKGDLAFSNTPIVSEHDAEEAGFKVVSFAETKPLPSYLVALGVGPFEVVEAGRVGLKGTPVRIIAPKGRSSEARYAVEVSPVVLGLLEKYFEIPYPYEKLDVLSVPLTTDFGAMENAGLVTVSQTLMVAQPHNQSISFGRGYAGLAAHEFGHMWFGDLVTTAWWDDIWLNEAFATWISDKIIDQWKPAWSHGTNSVNSRAAAMGSDSLVNARQIRQPILSEDDIVNAFDGITYQKGASVLRMFEHWIGEDTFRRGIHRYLERHAFGVATAADFLAAISMEAGKDIAPAFSTFLDQPGVPLVTASLKCNRDSRPKLILSQERYLPVGSTGSVTQQTWQIPVCARYQAGRVSGRSCTVLTEKAGELDLGSLSRCPDWVLPNEGEIGYYRTLYEGDLLQRLLQGGGKQLSLPERVGVLNDVNALVRNGRLFYKDVLKLIPALAKDKNREVVASAISIIGSLRQRLISTSLRPQYAAFVRKVFGARAKALGWKARPNDDEDTRLLRPGLLSLVADAGEERSLQAEAKRLTIRWLSDRQAVDSDTIDSLLSVAARHGDRALFKRLRSAARKETERRDRRRLISALGAFRNQEIVREALATVLSDDFDPRESIDIMFRAASEAETRDLAYSFVKQNFDALIQRLPRDWGSRLPGVAGGYCDEAHRADVESFFGDRSAQFTGGKRTLAQTLEQINLCAAFWRIQQPSVAAFFGRPTKPATSG